MANTALQSVITRVASVVDSDPTRYAKTREIEAAYPGLGSMLLELAGAGVSDSLGQVIASGISSDKGIVRGRAGSVTSVDPEPAEPVAEFTIRPNGQKYFHRVWGTAGMDVDVLRKMRASKRYVFFFGPPGTGKTALPEAAFGTELVTLIGSNDIEVPNLIGSWVPTGNPAAPYRWVDGPLLIAAREGRPLYIDEIGLIAATVLSVLYSAMDGRGFIDVSMNPEIGRVEVADGFYVVAATNPKAPGVRLSEAMLSRFGVHVEVISDWDRALKMGVSADMITVAKSLWNKVEKGVISWSPQFRELMEFRDLSRDFGVSFALQNLLATTPENARVVVAEALKATYSKEYYPARLGDHEADSAF